MIRVDAWLRCMRTGLLPKLWTPQCVLCGDRGAPPANDLCRGCEQDLRRNECCCEICAEPLEAGESVMCGACVQRRPRFDRCTAPYRYSYPLDHMIRRLKYGGGVAEGRVLGQLLAQSLVEMQRLHWPELLLPVPLGRARFVDRGYNQAIELATYVSHRLAIPMRTDLLVRTRDTLEQAALDRKARRKNLRKAFALTQPIRERHVAILDDVVTTGSTANEVARVLKRAGVQQVEVWAVARAGRTAIG